MKHPIELDKLQEEILSPEKYLSLNEKEKATISYTEIVPPGSGKKDFGGIKVHYKYPIYMRSR